MTDRIPLSRQIAEIQREQAQRRKVYPNLVAKGSYRQSEVDFLNANLQGVLDTLVWLQSNEDEIRAFLALPAEARRAMLSQAGEVVR
jgi:hypothetical protein